jgi:hypothetical protein
MNPTLVALAAALHAFADAVQAIAHVDAIPPTSTPAPAAEKKAGRPKKEPAAGSPEGNQAPPATPAAPAAPAATPPPAAGVPLVPTPVIPPAPQAAAGSMPTVQDIQTKATQLLQAGIAGPEIRKAIDPQLRSADKLTPGERFSAMGRLVALGQPAPAAPAVDNW